MTEDVRDLLPLYALGILEPEEAAAVERAIAEERSAHEARGPLAKGSVARDQEQHPLLAVELAALQRTADALVVPVVPSPEVKERLLASVGGGRYERFATRIGDLFDVGLDRARELLALIERAVSWDRQIPGIELVHFEGGAAAAAADCGFIRIAPGAVFPLHTHVREESAIILAGRVRDVTHDRVYSAGDEYVMDAGSSHQLACESNEACMFAVRASGGIRVGGVAVAPKLS